MKGVHKVYIALGSNKGNKLRYLQTAVDMVYRQVGDVSAISRLYKTPAWGFHGADFFNACIEVKTAWSPRALLNILQSIEYKLGRRKTASQGYVSREIDLDILFYDDVVIAHSNLIIPHPELHKRKFVLYPLLDIAKEAVHPKLDIALPELLYHCTDTSEIQPIDTLLQNPKDAYRFKRNNFIAIEGNIGAGKTSLATKIAQEFNAKLILERFADNPFLPKFYELPERYAFTLEMSFLADRYQQISEDLSQLDLFKDFIISDYDVHKSLIFSKITLPDDEFRLYRKLFYQVFKDIANPDVYVYLYQNTERLQKNIKKRGRDYENTIKADYLDKIHKGYLEFLKSYTNLNVKTIDISDKDFVNNREDYVWVLDEINL